MVAIFNPRITSLRSLEKTGARLSIKRVFGIQQLSVAGGLPHRDKIRSANMICTMFRRMEIVNDSYF